jgi:hypothetical protein
MDYRFRANDEAIFMHSGDPETHEVCRDSGIRSKQHRWESKTAVSRVQRR